MLKMRLGLPEVAGSPQAEAAYGLRYGGLDPGPQSVGADELGRFLTLSRRLQGDVLVTCPEGHEAPHCGRAGAVGPVSTSPAVLRGELHLDDGRPAVVDRRGPAGAVDARRTGDPPRVPVDGEGFHGEALAGLRLPPEVGAGRADQVDPEVTPRLHQQTGTEIARVDDVLRREQALASERAVEGRRDIAVRDRAGAVVCTSVRTLGRPSSQVSLRCAL
jgi:hypothetical protein